MPAATAATGEERSEKDQKMWNALKRYIIRERQRKKEEYEAEVEEERLRKEKEARERQDVMTLEDTKEQIDQLEQKLKQLEKEKQQLFMQLKKVLNEDEVRKRQQQKESNEMPPMKMQQGMQMGNFSLQMSGGQGDQQPTQGRQTPMSAHILNKPPLRGPAPLSAGNKRARSPSPTYALYAHRQHPPMKHQPIYEHKLDDGRMSGRQMNARAVLWNKPTSQYPSNVSGSSVTPSGYYAMPTSGVVVSGVERPPPLLYAHHAHAHAHAPHTPHHAVHLYPQPLYRDMLDTKEPPQVLIGLSESSHHAPPPPVSSGVVYAPPVSRHQPGQPHLQTSAPGITQGYSVAPSKVQSTMYGVRTRY